MIAIKRTVIIVTHIKLIVSENRRLNENLT